MGIRFYCPNGHKLNVKDFQAGRKGICPFCGAKVQIPLENTRPSSRHRSPRQPKDVPADAPPPLRGIRSPTIAAGPVPNAAIPTATSTVPPPSATSQPTITDPLAEAGEAVWYVRPSSGGQFGPATPGVMRAWLTEGRIGADALVWREGWRDWQEAGDVFPQLSTVSNIPGLESVLSETLAVTVNPRPLQHHKQSRSTQLMLIGALALSVLILFVIFIVVLMNQ